MRLIGLAALFYLVACATEPVPASSVALELASDPRTIQTDLGLAVVEIDYSIRNGRAQVVYVEICGPAYGVAVETRTSDGWQPYVSSTCAATADRDTFALAPSESVLATIRFLPTNRIIFRLVLPFGLDRSVVGEDSATSRAFQP